MQRQRHALALTQRPSHRLTLSLTHIDTLTQTHARALTHIDTHTNARTYAPTYPGSHTYTRTLTHIDTQKHTYTRTLTHTQARFGARWPGCEQTERRRGAGGEVTYGLSLRRRQSKGTCLRERAPFRTTEPCWGTFPPVPIVII